jgi:hypothetical protein
MCSAALPAQRFLFLIALRVLLYSHRTIYSTIYLTITKLVQHYRSR